MLLSRIEVVSGSHCGIAFEPKKSIVTIGRSGDNDLALPHAEVGEHHLRIRIGIDEVQLETDLAGWHTAVLRNGKSLSLDEHQQRMRVGPGDEIELGDARRENPVRIALRFAPEESFEPQVIATRPIGRWEQPESASRMSEVMTVLSNAERNILSATGIEQVYIAVLDAALGVISRATHATLILRDEPVDDNAGAGSGLAYIPVMTRARRGDGVIEAAAETTPIARSIFRKVIHDRNSVLAADATLNELGSESLLGSNIRSTVAVPLWRNEAIVGVLELDNRARPAMFDKADLDLVSARARITDPIGQPREPDLPPRWPWTAPLFSRGHLVSWQRPLRSPYRTRDLSNDFTGSNTSCAKKPRFGVSANANGEPLSKL